MTQKMLDMPPSTVKNMPTMTMHSTAVAIPERRPGPGRAAVFGGATRARPKLGVTEEHDVVKLATDAHEKDGFKKGAEGTVVLIHADAGKPSGWYMVEFNSLEEILDDNILDLHESEVELVWKSGMG